MTLKYLKPLIGIHVDEPLDFQNPSENQKKRISLATQAWEEAAGLSVALSLALTGAVDPDLELVPLPEEQRCFAYAPLISDTQTQCKP